MFPYFATISLTYTHITEPPSLKIKPVFQGGVYYKGMETATKLRECLCPVIYALWQMDTCWGKVH